MTDSIPSSSTCWASLDECLHQHHSVIAGDLRLQAAHAAFQLQLATLRAIQPDSPAAQPGPSDSSVRAYLEFQLQEISANILQPASNDSVVADEKVSPTENSKPQTLLEQAEDTVRHLRDNPSLWTRFGLAALQVRALADLHNAYALETGALVPAGDLTERVKSATEEIGRLIRQELDPLVRAHEAGAPSFVADYRQARTPKSQPETEVTPAATSRSWFFRRFRKAPELSLSN